MFLILAPNSIPPWPAPGLPLRPPTLGRWYFGIHADGQTGALAQWNGWAFVNSESDDVNMGIYHHLQEQPPRG